MISLGELNNTELREIARLTTGIRTDDSNEIIVPFLETKTVTPAPSKFNRTRRVLEQYLETRWSSYATEMPCKGESLAGKCTRHSCTNLIHSSCFLGLKDRLQKEGLIG